jgi:lipopolysaccharide/colanic/teichoic acid biosynthesis glycosyltransferase
MSFVLLSISWTALSHFFTNTNLSNLKIHLPWIAIITMLTWSFIIARLRKNEITIAATQELNLYIITYPAISLLTVLFFKTFYLEITINYIPFTTGAVTIACLTWLMIRTFETFEFNFGRKIKIHSKLNYNEYQAIVNAIVNTRFEKNIDLKRVMVKEDIAESDLLIVSSLCNMDEEIIAAHLAGVKIESYDQFIHSLHGRISADEQISSDYISLRRLSPLFNFYHLIKNTLSPIVAFTMGIILLPLFILVGLAIRLTSKGPAIFKQIRTGHNNKLFTVYKFRTMYIDAEKDGPKWSNSNDSRVTPLGKFLRAAHIDELPQLLNVIKGEMSFVGPRPELPEFYQSLKKDIPNFHLRTLIMPGITGWAQIKGGYANSVEASKVKLEFDLYYIFYISPLLDLQIIVDTVFGNKTKFLLSLSIEKLQKETTVLRKTSFP